MLPSYGVSCSKHRQQPNHRNDNGALTERPDAFIFSMLQVVATTASFSDAETVDQLLEA